MTAVEVILPRVDMDMTAGRIARWYVAEGETVEKGQPLFEIETDKAAMEIEAPGSGILHDVVAAAEAAIPVGSVVARIRPAGEAAAPVAPPAVAPPATPLARRLARQNGVALAAVRGSGPRGRIQARDVPAGRRPASIPAPPEPAAEPASARLHRVWLREGRGRPLVLVHGFGAELNGWRPLVAHLAPGQPVLALDLPGHGGSPAASAPSLTGFAEALAGTLAEEGVTSADLAGHSLGAAVVCRLAEIASFEVRSLLLLAPAGLGPDINAAFLDGFLRARSAESLGPWLRLLVADPATLGPGFVQATQRGRTEAVLEAQAEVARALFPDGTQAFSIRDALARLAMPVRVVFGSADRIIPARHARGLPGAVALHLFRGVGHLPQVEIGAAVARIVAEHHVRH